MAVVAPGSRRRAVALERLTFAAAIVSALSSWACETRTVYLVPIGDSLMGAGGVMAFGCSIGQGLTGFSTLALASLIAFAGILVGSAAGLRGALRVRPLAAA